MGRKNLNPKNANQLRYKTLGSSFTNLVTKNSLICLLWFICEKTSTLCDLFNEIIEISNKSYTI